MKLLIGNVFLQGVIVLADFQEELRRNQKESNNAFCVSDIIVGKTAVYIE